MKLFKRLWKGFTTPMSPTKWRIQSAPPRYKQDDAEALCNFTPHAQQVLALARREADRFQHHFVGTEHLLLGIIALGQGTAVSVLTKMGLKLEVVRQEVEKQVGSGPDERVKGNIPYTPRVKKVLHLAAAEAKYLKHTYVGTEHILLGLLREGDGVAARVLRSLDIDVDVTRNYVLRQLDPNVAAANEPKKTVILKPEPPKPPPDIIDLSKRYDVYCREGSQEMVYRNVLFKRMKKLFQKEEFIELEEADGQTVFVARSSVLNFASTLQRPVQIRRRRKPEKL